jgi:BirA family biotin operon repressor/biotin-[acetyl-CoA-carboxylase] ligase
MDSEALLTLLADGRPHSGQALAESAGVAPAAVCKRIGKLERWGLEIEAVPGVGYRLARPLDLLGVDAVAAALTPAAAHLVQRLDLFAEIDSTNRYLLERPPSPDRMAVCLAEYQHAGRGRRGRAWAAPYAGGLCLSVGWHFAETPPGLSALTLACGVAARRVLARLAGVSVLLKWPNDLVWDERKLGGILVELAAGTEGGRYAVVGLGLNVAMPARLLARLSDWPSGAVDLAQATRGAPPGRAGLAAGLIVELAELFRGYGTTGFAPYRAEFEAADCLKGRRVTIDDAAGGLEGIACGIEADGALRVEVGRGRHRRVLSGDVSVRWRPQP